MNKWFPICNYTHYSLCRGFSKPEKLVAKCKLNGYRACGIADYKSLSGVINFYKVCKAMGVKPILGCSFGEFSLFAKNKDGWRDLLEIHASFDEVDNYNIRVMAEVCRRGNLICITEDHKLTPIRGDDLYIKTNFFPDIYYVDKDEAELHRVMLCAGSRTTMNKLPQIEGVSRFLESDDFYLKDSDEILEMLIDESSTPNFAESADVQFGYMDDIFDKCQEFELLSSPVLPTYDTGEQSEEDYFVDLCRKGWRKLISPIVKDDEKKKQIYLERYKSELAVIRGADLLGYFLIVMDIVKYAEDNGWLVGAGRGSAAGCLTSYLLGITKADPIEFDLIFERFYSAGRNIPNVASFIEMSFDEFREKSSDESLIKHNSIRPKSIDKLFTERVEEIKDNPHFVMEKNTLKNQTVEAYYTYVLNYLRLDETNPLNSYIAWAAGKVESIDMNKPCDITKGKISLPDIDIDIPASKRDIIIEYVKNKYGHERVGQIVTFGRLCGRSAIKEVLRVYEACGFSEMNEITKYIPDEAAISDQLEEMEASERSIILWALENNTNELRDFCYVGEGGELHGAYSEYFAKAIAIEGTFKNRGKHAAGIVISKEPLVTICPMGNQVNGPEKIADWEMDDLDAVGIVKLDVLGLSLLDRLMYVKELKEARANVRV